MSILAETKPTFADGIKALNAAYENQPQEPATTCRDGEPAIGWTWAGAWKPACAAHMSPISNHQIYNTEFQEDE